MPGLMLVSALLARRNVTLGRGDRREIPGAVRASAGLSTSAADVDRLLAAVSELAGGKPDPIAYAQDFTGDFAPAEDAIGWPADDGASGLVSCQLFGC